MPLTITHAKSNTLGDFTGTVTVFNSAGTTTTAVATDLVRPTDWNSGHAYTIALTASEVAPVFNFRDGLTSSTAAGGISVGVGSDPWFQPFILINTNSTLSSPGIGTWYLDGPYEFDQGIGSGQINCLVSNAAGFIHGTTFSAASSGSMSWSATFYNNLAIYKQGTGGSTSRLESVWTGRQSILASQNLLLATANTSSGTISNALTLSFPSQWDASGGVTYGSTAQSGSTTMNASTIASSHANNLVTGAVAYVSGARMDVVGLATHLTPGIYWLAHQFTSSTSSAGTAGGVGTAHVLFSTHSRLGLLENAIGAYKRIGASVSNSTSNPVPFHGYLATTTSGATSIINTSDVRATTGRMYWNYFQSSQ